MRWTLVVAMALVTVACGGSVESADTDPAEAPGVGPRETADDDPAATPGREAASVCRPALEPGDLHPVRELSATPHPDLQTVDATIEELVRLLATDHRDVGAGVWLDQGAGEIVVMLTDGGAILPDLRSRVDHPDLVVCMDAIFTQDELEAIEAIARELLPGPATLSIDTVANRVEVEVEVDGDAFTAALRDRLTPDRFAAVDVEVPACAEVTPIPAHGVALPGGASTCWGMAALAGGTLVGDDACAWLEGPDGQVLALVWPRGWWLDGEGVVHDHQGTPRAAIGDEVEVGGGIGGDRNEDACGPGDVDQWVVASLDRAG